MFLPFLPYLVAMGGLSALFAMPRGGLDAGGAWAVGLIYAALPLWGIVVGQLPHPAGAVRGERVALARRAIYLAGWFLVLAMTALPQQLAEMAAPLVPPEGAMVALMLNFWVGDALSQQSFLSRRMRREAGAIPDGMAGLAGAGPSLGSSLRLPLPVLVLILAGAAWTAAMRNDWLPALDGVWDGAVSGALLGVFLMAGLAMLAVPVLIRVCWGLKPFPGPQAGSLMRGELADNRATVTRIFAWPEGLTGHVTAGVVGLLPGFRYLLVSPTLAAVLTPRELQAVIAHEAGHIRFRHLWYFVAALAGFVLLLQGLLSLVTWAGLYYGFDFPMWLVLLLEIAALLVFLRFGIGFASRWFERQADGNAVRRAGADAFSRAIAKVAGLNHIPMERDNWHHFGVARRIDFARQGEADPGQLTRHDRNVSRLKAGLLMLLVLGLAAEVALNHRGVSAYLGESLLARRVEANLPPTENQLSALRYLAARAFARDDLPGAERYFRLILTVRPESAEALNNLAWVLVTHPRAPPERLREGLELAQSAVTLGQAAFIWDTLAESYFRLNRFEQAIEAAHRALILAQAGQGRGKVSLEYYQGRLESFERHSPGG